MTTQKVAVVTGSNKGIGYAIVKGLCEKFQGIVYLTARDTTRGEAAVTKLKSLGLQPKFHQLDITDQSSIDKLKDHLVTTYGGLDLLVNNAAMAFKGNATEPFSTQARETIKVNYFGTLKVCDALFPILRTNARVVNLSSSAGHLSRIPSTNLRSKLKDPALTVPELNKLMEQFVEDAKQGKHGKEWGHSAYAVSKVGVSALTRVQQKLFDSETPNRNVAVNSVHPGYVDTDLSSHMGPLTIEEGARAPLFLALQADSTVKGKFVWDTSKIVKDAKQNKHGEEWGHSAYVVSKVGVSALTQVQQRQFDSETPNRNIVVNSVHPGYVDTDMTSHKGPLTIEEGAQAPLFLALQADSSVKGKFIWYTSKIIKWDSDTLTA